MHSLPDSLQSLLEDWCAQICLSISDQRKRRQRPQYDQKLGCWCGCQGYNPYYSTFFKKDLAQIPPQWVQTLLDALQQKLEKEGIVPIRMEIGQGGFALRAVRLDALTAAPEKEDSPPVLDVLFAHFL